MPNKEQSKEFGDFWRRNVMWLLPGIILLILSAAGAIISHIIQDIDISLRNRLTRSAAVGATVIAALLFSSKKNIQNELKKIGKLK